MKYGGQGIDEWFIGEWLIRELEIGELGKKRKNTPSTRVSKKGQK